MDIDKCVICLEDLDKIKMRKCATCIAYCCLNCTAGWETENLKNTCPNCREENSKILETNFEIKKFTLPDIPYEFEIILYNNQAFSITTDYEDFCLFSPEVHNLLFHFDLDYKMLINTDYLCQIRFNSYAKQYYFIVNNKKNINKSYKENDYQYSIFNNINHHFTFDLNMDGDLVENSFVEKLITMHKYDCQPCLKNFFTIHTYIAHIKKKHPAVNYLKIKKSLEKNILYQK